MDEVRGEATGPTRHDRVRRRLDQFGQLVGIVVGQFNEVSDDTHTLIEQMADSRVNMVSRREGRQMSDQEKGIVVGQLRRQLSTACIRAASQCLLDRMDQCGEGAALAAKRREVNLVLEERMRGERELQWLAKLRGGQVVRKGQFFQN